MERKTGRLMGKNLVRSNGAWTWVVVAGWREVVRFWICVSEVDLMAGGVR